MKTQYFSDKHIPEEMKKYHQWVLWRYVYRNEKEKPAKIPIDPKSGQAASVSNPSTWASYSQTVQALSEYRCEGVGFVFTENDPFVGIDFDDCVIDEFWGDATDKVEELKTLCSSYWESSPSQKGIHIIVKGKLPDGINGYNNRNGIEMYSSGRYFCITALPEYMPHGEIVENQSAIDTIYYYAKATAITVKGSPIEKPTSTKPKSYDLKGILNYPFPEGSRNISLFQLCCTFRTYGADDKQVNETIETANRTRCKPPLSSDEVAIIARSVCRYKKGRGNK